MEDIGKIVGINLLIFVLYTLIIHAVTGRDAAITGSMIAYAHAGGIFIIGLVMVIFDKGKVRHRGAGLILAALLITVIGFSVCLGTFNLRLH